MILILCAEKKGGVLFGSRRVSRDRSVTEKILSLTEGKKLFLSPDSRTLFPEDAPVLSVSSPIGEAKEGDFLFWEGGDLPKEAIEEILLFRWDRNYPATVFFKPEEMGFHLAKKSTFQGFSHEKILEERWEKK